MKSNGGFWPKIVYVTSVTVTVFLLLFSVYLFLSKGEQTTNYAQSINNRDKTIQVQNKQIYGLYSSQNQLNADIEALKNQIKAFNEKPVVPDTVVIVPPVPQTSGQSKTQAPQQTQQPASPTGVSNSSNPPASNAPAPTVPPSKICVPIVGLCL